MVSVVVVSVVVVVSFKLWAQVRFGHLVLSPSMVVVLALLLSKLAEEEFCTLGAGSAHRSVQCSLAAGGESGHWISSVLWMAESGTSSAGSAHLTSPCFDTLCFESGQLMLSAVVQEFSVLWSRMGASVTSGAGSAH